MITLLTMLMKFNTNTFASFYRPRFDVDDEAKLKALQEVSDSFDVSGDIPLGDIQSAARF